MRYELDANGYILAVYWGCYSGTGKCTEYTGTIPSGYKNLNDWSENALINAYYIADGNLVLDYDKLVELEEKIEQDTIDNIPLLRKDLYGYTDAINKQYVQKEASGSVISIDDVEKINPVVKITNIDCYSFNKVDIITQGKNMLKVDAVNETIEGITFTKLISGGIRISGTATADVEYNLLGSNISLASLFALKKNKNYYLNIGDLDCELNYYDGTTSQVYKGSSGIINLSESKAVTQVLIKIPNGTTLDKTIYPMLEYGTSPSVYEEYKSRVLTIDFSELVVDGVLPSDDLYPSDNLFPAGTIIDYIFIENGSVYVSADGVQKYLVKGNVNLFDGYDTVYTLQDTNLEMTYYIDSLVVEESISRIVKEQDNIKLEVGKKVNEEEIVSSINLSKEEIKIDGKKISLANFNVSDNKLTSEIKVKCDYTEADTKKIADYIMGRTTLTADEINKYDINKDGVVDTVDFTIIMQQMNSGITVNNSGKFEINTTPDDLNVINLYDGLGELKYYIGYWVNKLKYLTTESIETESISAGNIDCGNGYCSSNGYTTIEFNKEFYAEPYITATPITTENGVIALKITNITTTSFDITIGGTGFSDDIEFNWIAILP